MRDIYLDNNATTQPLPEVIAAMTEYMELGFGNPSSPHHFGARARDAVEMTREAVLKLLGADSYRLVFTSGGSESASMVMGSLAQSGEAKTGRVVTTRVEHSSILANCEYLEALGFEVVYVPVSPEGLLDVARLRSALSHPADLVVVHWVNNETGCIQDIEQISKLCTERSIPLFVDGAQAVGKLPIELDELGPDYLSFSAHKFHGPQGVGGLLTKGRGGPLQSIVRGGDQESGLRAGTENVPGIVGLGVAADCRRQRLSEVIERTDVLRDRFEGLVLNKCSGVTVNGCPSSRVSNTTNLHFSGLDGQAIIAQLDSRGVYCSQGSACTSSRPESSYVLREMGLNESEAYASVRFSFSELNKVDDPYYAAEHVRDICSRLQSLLLDEVAS